MALYRPSRLTSLVVRHILRPTIRHATLPNLLGTWPSLQQSDSGGGESHVGDGTLRHLASQASSLGGAHLPELIPELLLEQCTEDAVTEAASRLLHEPAAAAAQVATARLALDGLRAEDAHGHAVPSATAAARALLRHLPGTVSSFAS